MAFLSQIDIALSGAVAQRLRMDVIGQNIANSHTTSTETGEPYRRKMTVLAENLPYANIDTSSKLRFGQILGLSLEERRERKLGGVTVMEIVDDTETPFTPVYDPTHPDADENGYYYMPNVDVAEEEMDLIAATRAYEANLEVMQAMVDMANKALTIGK